MSSARSTRGTRALVGLAAGLSLLLASGMAFAQSTTATVRGTVQDSSGGVLPGATITITHTGTKAMQTSVTDDRGGYLFSGLFPGVYDLKVEMPSFKTYEQKSITLSPADNRGIDVRLEIGEQTETITVTAQQEVIQTETGAREGVLNASQIDNLSVMGRSALELLRILPGVVVDYNIGDNVANANGTQNYTVNGIRSSSNTVMLDGSNVIDVGCNCGLMVSLNNDMVQEVKIQSSNFAAEYGTGGMNVSGVTKAGTSQFHGTLYDYYRPSELSANDRSNSITGVDKPKSKYQFPGGNVGGPIFFGDSYTRNRDKLFFFFAFEAQRQEVDSGSRFTRTLTPAMKNGDFSELLANRGDNLNSIPQLRIPIGHPNAGQPAPNNDMTPYMTPLGRYLGSLYPDPNYSDPDNQFNYVYSALEPQNRTDLKMRFDWNISNNTKAFVRFAREGQDRENPRGAWWSPSDVALPTANVEESRGRSFSGNLVSVLSPTMTNEAIVTYTKLTLDNFWDDPSLVQRGAGGVDFVGFQFPDGYSNPVELPTQLLHGWGTNNGQVGNLWSAAPNVFAYNDTLQFSNKLTKLWGSHGLKFGIDITRGQKQQDFQNNESGQLWFSGSDNNTGTGNSAADMLVGSIGQFDQGGARNGQPQPGMPYGEFRFWAIDAFAQDSWKLRPNLTLEYGVRFGKWTNNEELLGSAGYFSPSQYDPNAGSFKDPGTFQLVNGICYVYTGCAPSSTLPQRPAFALPRANVAWDIDGQGNNVVRGGYGIFFNRPMGNVEYDNAIRLPPNAYAVNASFWTHSGLNYDNVRNISMADRVGSIGVNSPDPDSLEWPTTHSFSVSYARRIPFNQVVEVAYVGSRQRDLVSRTNGNVMPFGVLSTGTYNGVDLSVPANRVAVASDGERLAAFRPFNALSGLTLYDFRGESNYDSMQVTLSRQTGKRLQYFSSYTLAKSRGTLGGEYAVIDPYNPDRTFGVLPEERRHVFNISWNAFLPDGARGAMDNVFGRGLLNGWQMSGISTVATGRPIRLSFTGDAAAGAVSAAWFGTADVVGPSNGGGNGLAPAYTCDPRLGGGDVGERLLNLDCISVPAFGQDGDLVPPYDLREPLRMNHDLTLFKNFQIRGEQKIQFRIGFFNLFNQAFATTQVTGSDINLSLDTRCNVRVNAPNGTGSTTEVCDPTQGFFYTDQTRDNFGNINLLRGRRVIELVLKYYF